MVQDRLETRFQDFPNIAKYGSVLRCAQSSLLIAYACTRTKDNLITSQ